MKTRAVFFMTKAEIKTPKIETISTIVVTILFLWNIRFSCLKGPIKKKDLELKERKLPSKRDNSS